MAGDFGEKEGMGRLFGEQSPPKKAIVPIFSEDVRGPGGELPSEAADRERQAKIASRGFKQDEDDNIPRVEADEILDPETLKKRNGNGEKTNAPKTENMEPEYENPFKEGGKVAAAGIAGAIFNEFSETKKNQKEENKDTLKRRIEELDAELKIRSRTSPTTEEGKRIRAENIRKLEFEKKAAMGGGSGIGGGEGTKDKKESEPEKRSFNEIQHELKALVNTPDRDKELKLKKERDPLLKQAKKDEILKGIKYSVRTAQKSVDFPMALDRVARLDIQILEDQARVTEGWSDLYEGMIEEYRDLAIIHMNLADLKAQNRGDSRQARELEREIDVRGWGEPPDDLENMARAYRRGRESEPTDIHTERKQSLREIPLYFGAVFGGGKNEVYVDRPDLIPTLDVTNEADRKEFILRNIYAFNYRFGNGSAWKGAVDDWIKDFNIASEGAGLSSEEKGDFIKELKAMMAITASARAMEASGGQTPAYLKIVLGVNERGDGPNIDNEDLWDSYLLHTNPNKLNSVVDDPLIRPFYDRILEDAGLKKVGVGTDDKLEWKNSSEPNEVKLVTNDMDKLRGKGSLYSYLQKLDSGGFQKYIEDVLLEEIGGTAPIEIRMVAARLACDAFMVDKLTRWEYQISPIPQGKTIRGKLYPTAEWAGDPLGTIMVPTVPARAMGFYSETPNDVKILDLVDSSAYPIDIFNEIKRKYSGSRYEGLEKVHPVVPSMVTKASSISRIADVAYKITGGGTAPGLASWIPKVMNEELPQTADLMNRVYGRLVVKEARTGREIHVGKHIVGAMISRAIYAKSLAATSESAKPDFKDVSATLFDPQRRDRPFLEVMQYLFGPKIDAKAGFFYILKTSRSAFVFRNNMFDAEKYFDATYNLLNTNDQSGGNYAGAVNVLGKALRIVTAIGEGFGIVKGR